MALEKDKKNDIISKFRTHNSDTGSTEVQIALLSERMTSLASHFQTHKKAHNSRRGLLQIVGQRRSLLEYLKKHNRNKYEEIIKQLGIRK